MPAPHDFDATGRPTGLQELETAFTALERELPPAAAQRVHAMREPRSRGWRMAIGLTLLAGSVLWFVPVLGLELLPIALIVLALDVPLLRRPVARLVFWGLRLWHDVRPRGRPHAH